MNRPPSIGTKAQHILLRTFDRLHDLLCMKQKRPSLHRQRHTLLPTIDEHQANLGLQRFDRLRDRRLGNVESLRRAREVFEMGERAKIFQLSNFQAIPSSSSH